MLSCMYYASIYICIFYKYCMCVWRYGDDIWQVNDEEHLSKGVYDTYTKTNLHYSQVRSTMHVVWITQHNYTYTDTPRWHRWTCSKKATPTQISLHKLICTLPPVPSTTSNSLQRVCYCIEYFVCIYCIICMYCTYAIEFMYAWMCVR
jgi:hypothetical protein